MRHYPDQDVADNRRSVRRRVRQLEQRQRRALREQGQRLLERAGRVLLVGPVGGGPVGLGHRNLRTAASIRWPIHLTFGTAQLFPNARYLGPSG